MKTYNQFICNLAADDAEEKTEEDGVVGEDAGEGGDWQTGEELVLVQLYKVPTALLLVPGEGGDCQTGEDEED